MPKRKSEDQLSYIIKKLKYLEKEVKRNKRVRSESSSSSSDSSSSRSSNSSSSRKGKNYDRALTEHGERPHVQLTDLEEAAHPQLPQTAASPLPSTSKATEGIQPRVASPQPSTSHDAYTVISQQKLMQTVDETQLPDVQHVTDTPSDTLNPDILDILGSDPTTTVVHGSPINMELANRLTYIATSGLKKEEIKEICSKYLIPENCQGITAPQLNPEIKAALSEGLRNRDKALELRQTSIATVISCLSKIMSTQIVSNQPDHDMLQQLFDATRLLCDIQYNDSASRKAFALSILKKDLKEQLANTKIGKQLFGDSLGETIKTAKAVSKSGADLKEPVKKTNPYTTKNLNWKSTTGTRRPAAVPSSSRRQPPTAPSTATNTFQHRRQHPPPPPPPPKNSSNTSSRRSRQNRGR